MAKRYFKDKTLESDIPALDNMRYTLGLAVPRQGSKRACLCSDKETYSVGCCRERLINQGIGTIQGAAAPITAFQKPSFSNAFA